jgi:hypothetical protein
MAAAQRHQFSGEDPWVSVDAAVSNDLFFADHFPMQLAQINRARWHDRQDRERRAGPLSRGV